MKKTMMTMIADYCEKNCKMRQAEVVERWTKPIGDQGFYRIINACCNK